MGDPIAFVHDVVVIWVEVHQRHLDLTAVTRINQAGGISAGDSVSKSQATAGQNEATKTRRNGDGDAGTNERTAAAWCKSMGFHGNQVEAGVAFVRATGHNCHVTQFGDGDIHGAKDTSLVWVLR